MIFRAFEKFSGMTKCQTTRPRRQAGKAPNYLEKPTSFPSSGKLKPANWHGGAAHVREEWHGILTCTKKFKIKKEAFPTTYSKVAGNGLDRQS